MTMLWDNAALSSGINYQKGPYVLYFITQLQAQKFSKKKKKVF